MLRLLEPVLFHPAVQPCCGSPYVGSRAFLSRETAGQMPQCQCRQQAVAGQIARHIGTRHAAGRPATGKQAIEHRTVCPLYPRLRQHWMKQACLPIAANQTDLDGSSLRIPCCSHPIVRCGSPVRCFIRREACWWMTMLV